MKKNNLFFLGFLVVIVGVCFIFLKKNTVHQVKSFDDNIEQIARSIASAEIVKSDDKVSNSHESDQSSKSQQLYTVLQKQEKTEKAQAFGLKLGQYLSELNSGKAKAGDRAKLIELGKDIPLEMAMITDKVLEQLPPDEHLMKNDLIAVLMNSSQDSVTKLSAAEQDAFFMTSYVIAERELKTDERQFPAYLSELSQDDKNKLLHAGVLAEKNGQVFVPTLSTKVMALSLIKLDPQASRRDLFFNEVIKQHGDLSPEAIEILQLVNSRSL